MLVEFDTDQNNAVILARLATVLDPELDASIVELGFVHALRVHDRQAHVTLELPTSWCAMNFAFLMAEDVRKALLALDGIEAVTVRLGDHCVAAEIEAAVNDGKSFSAAFPSESGGEFSRHFGTRSCAKVFWFARSASCMNCASPVAPPTR